MHHGPTKMAKRTKKTQGTQKMTQAQSFHGKTNEEENKQHTTAAAATTIMTGATTAVTAKAAAQLTQATRAK